MVGRFDVFDHITHHHGLLAVAIDQRQRTVVIIDDQAAQDTSVAESDRCRLVLLANLGAGVDEAVQEEIQVTAVGAGQFGADRLAVIKEFMADSAVVFEDRFAAGGVPFIALGKQAPDLGNPPFFLGRTDPRDLAPER